MASPVTGSDFTLYTQMVGVCEKLTYLMGSMEKVKALVDYMYDEDGEATQALLSLGLPPPGTIFAYWTTTTDWTTAKAEVERLGRTDADVASGTGPLYRICDGTNATPDLRARTIVGASNTTTPTLADGLTQRAVNTTGGIEEATLTNSSIPDHNHKLGAYGTAAAGTDNDMVFESIPVANVTAFTGRLLFTSGSGEATLSVDKINTITGARHAEITPPEDEPLDPVATMPPFHCLYWIIRTSRTS